MKSQEALKAERIADSHDRDVLDREALERDIASVAFEAIDVEAERLIEHVRTERIVLDSERPSTLRSDGTVDAYFSDGLHLEIGTRSFGPKNGTPLLWLHGSPGYKSGPHPPTSSLYPANIRIIAITRLGYGCPESGGSTRQEGRIVADGASWIEAVAQAYGLDQFHVGGRSGGGPYALAGAALLPGRVLSVSAIGSISPVEDDTWRDGMGSYNREAYTKLVTNPSEQMQTFIETAGKRHGVLDAIMDNLPLSDRPSERRIPWWIFEALATSHVEGGGVGWYDDAVATQMPWGFSPRDIDPSVPAILLQGEEDPFTTKHHFDRLVAMMPHAHAVFLPNIGHLGTLGDLTLRTMIAAIEMSQSS